MTDNENHLNWIIDVSTFVPKSYRAPSAWIGHLPFASWLIKELSPKVFVELGTHTGTSYFTFCQSVDEAGLGTKCYAVDTWRGDEHAGHYDDQIFQQVSQYNSENYATFSQLMRMTFDEAATYFTDQSVELLHIDGLHTYEAVRSDFEKWLPKMAAGGLILFHDTNVRERGFGVWKLLDELKELYPFNLEFTHSYGLGVVQINESNETSLDWLKPGEGEKNRITTVFSALGAREIRRCNAMEASADEQQRTALLNQVVAERDASIIAAKERISSLDSALASMIERNKSLEKIVDSAKRWQKSWFKRTFHRWRPAPLNIELRAARGSVNRRQ
jgi:hypothetical protein